MSNASRGGSYLVSQILSTHPMVTVASEPFLELFRSFRNAIFYNDKELSSFYSKDDLETLPLQDYFFHEKIGEILQCLHAIDARRFRSVTLKDKLWRRQFGLQV